MQATLVFEADGNALVYVPAVSSSYCGFLTMTRLMHIEQLGDVYVDIANNAYVNVSTRSDLQQVGTAIFELRDENLEKDQPWTSNNS